MAAKDQNRDSTDQVNPQAEFAKVGYSIPLLAILLIDRARPGAQRLAARRADSNCT
jgi:hypothetical protein